LSVLPLEEVLGRVLDELARSDKLAIVAGLEGLMVSVDLKTPDGATASLLQALVECDVTLVLASRARRAAIDTWREQVRGAWWVAESGAWRCLDSSWRHGAALEPIDGWVGRLIPGADVIAIGDGFVIDEFPQLARYELAVHRAGGPRVRRRLGDVGNVHGVLWRVVGDRLLRAGVRP